MRFTPSGIAGMFRAWPYLRAMTALFDRDFYLHKYPDVAAAGVNPFRHYLEHGAEEGRKPHPLFDHDFYLLGCPEARDAAQPSIFHFLNPAVPYSNPHPLFDCESYLSAHPEAAGRRINPLVHYVRNQGPLPHGRGSEAGLTEPRAPASGSGGEPRINPALPFVRLEICDAVVTIAFGEPEPGPAHSARRGTERSPESLAPRRAGLRFRSGQWRASEVVHVWEDAEGRTRFLAPAEQRPFFGAMKYDQLRAQEQ